MTELILTADDPPPYRVIEGDLSSPFLFVCDHASNRIPNCLSRHSWDKLLDKHVAYDIGVAEITRHLSERFGAPAVLGNYSRLVADLNRFPDDPTFAAEVSDGHMIAVNQGLSDQQHQSRVDTLFAPYHCQVEMQIDRQIRSGVAPTVILVHSMTPAMNGFERDMEIDIMSMADRRVADRLLEVLDEVHHLKVADNDPYELEESDYTAIVHCVRRNLPHVQVEFRQDLVNTETKAVQWAEVLGDAIDRSGIAGIGVGVNSEVSGHSQLTAS